MSIIYSIYNIIISDNNKAKLRKRLSKIYKWYEPRYQYNHYISELKRCAKIAFFHQNKWDKSDEYINNLPYIVENFTKETRGKYLQNKICTMNTDMISDEMRLSIERVKNNGIDYFCHGIVSSEKVKKDDVGYDPQSELFYGMYHGKKLFFSSKTFDEAYENLQFLLYEQSDSSPHKYLTDTYNVDFGDVVFDVGCADGNFSLDVIEKASKCFLFETLDEWQKPLDKTFSTYKNKVEIVHKYVSDQTDGDSITIDDFCQLNNIHQIDMLKADIEGAEEQMLKGASRMISEGRIKKICICTYHTIDAEKNISKILSGYKKEMSNGYMIYSAWIGPIEEMKEPYLVKGVMRAQL